MFYTDGITVLYIDLYLGIITVEIRFTVYIFIGNFNAFLFDK